MVSQRNTRMRATRSNRSKIILTTNPFKCSKVADLGSLPPELIHTAPVIFAELLLPLIRKSRESEISLNESKKRMIVKIPKKKYPS